MNFFEKLGFVITNFFSENKRAIFWDILVCCGCMFLYSLTPGTEWAINYLFIALMGCLFAHDCVNKTYSQSWYPTLGMLGTFIGIPVYFLGYWSGTDESKFLESQKGIIHACESETSLMLAVDESLVDPIYKETKGNPGSVTPLEEAGLISTFHTMESHTENGVMGNSYLATKEKGEAMIAEMVQNLTRILSDDCLWHGRV